MEDSKSFECPFCDFVIQDYYFLIQHVELVHPEGGQSPFIAKDDQIAIGNNEVENSVEAADRDQSASDHAYVPCPYTCGERVLASELSLHTDFHLAEKMAIEEAEAEEPPLTVELSTGPCNDDEAVKEITDNFTTDLPPSLHNLHQKGPSSGKGDDRRSFADFLLGSPNLPQRQSVRKALASKGRRVRRLGRAELGPYAHERQMPAWLHKMLEEGAKVTVFNKFGPDGAVMRVEAVANETTDLVPVLARLSKLDQSVERAFYCSNEVRHVVKLPNEGGFCGYRNIQMLLSYIRDAKTEGHEHEALRGKRIPSILKLQDLIEQAWDMGFNSTGKVETGGIKGTRKYIGTPEAHALFQSLLIPCEAMAFSTTDDLPAYKSLLLSIAEYFSEDSAIDGNEKLHMTAKPPVYFQHQGHSLTIVGIEVRRNNSLNLIVFDPMFKPSPGLLRLINSTSFRVAHPDRLLKAHRRGAPYLEKYKDFEILKYDYTALLDFEMLISQQIGFAVNADMLPDSVPLIRPINCSPWARIVKASDNLEI